MADDVLANMQNILGYQGLVGQNPYLTYQGAIPFSNSYVTKSPFSGPVTMGPQDQLPTDAYGQPIQPPYGTTLTSTPPQAPAQAPAQAPPANSPITNQLASNAAMQRVLQNQTQNMSGLQGGTTGSGNQAPSVYGDPVGLAVRANAPPPGYGPYGYSANQAAMGITPQIAAARAAAFGAPGASAQSIGAQEGPGGALAAQAPGQAAGVGQAGGAGGGGPQQTGLTRQQYLYLLANPGPIKAVGAAPPQPGQAATGASQVPSVMQSFLAANPSGKTGFLNTLRGLS
jgi:hypothetical protein